MEIQPFCKRILAISLLQARSNPRLLPQPFESTGGLTSFSVWVSSFRMNFHMTGGFQLILMQGDLFLWEWNSVLLYHVRI